MRRTAVLWVIVILAVGIPLHDPFAATAAQGRVDPALSRALDQHPGGVGFLVLLRAKADLGAAAQISERTARAQAVAGALRETTRRSQAPLITLLQQMQSAGQVKRIQAFYSVNALGVVGTREAVAVLAAHPAVEAIELDPVITLPPVSKGSQHPQIDAVEWNIHKIQADDVWPLGFTGAGVTVANIDTGVRFTHEALITQYLCGPSGPHDACWFDAVNGLPTPYDDNNHGTHTMGTAVGVTPDNMIGVAPDANWIACKAFDAGGSGMGTAILACSDFLVPKAPAVINNSWGSFPPNTFFMGMVNSWLAAGIFPAFSNGNSGVFGCSSTGSPAAYAQSFGVGATDINDNIASFSSRGPSLVAPFPIKPDASAPGVNVRSSIATSDTAYAVFNGTSMAAPHVTGTVALLLSKNPSLTVPQLSSLITVNADVFVDLTCGGIDPRPNNVYGWGRINAFNAVQAAP